ncbi:MAG: hypothetical protein SH817_09950 [Leptospira sp.]|nr:hypothetical protein [Leptospira sp.]
MNQATGSAYNPQILDLQQQMKDANLIESRFIKKRIKSKLLAKLMNALQVKMGRGTPNDILAIIVRIERRRKAMSIK